MLFPKSLTFLRFILNFPPPAFANLKKYTPIGATEDSATCCRTNKLNVFPYLIRIGDVQRHKLHSITATGVALQIIYFTVAVML